MRRGLSLDQRGRGGMERRDALDGGMGEGRGCSGPTLGEGAEGGGSCPGPQGRGGQRLSQGPRGLLQEGPAIGLVRTSGAAHHPTPAVSPSQETPERPLAWEGPPADKACVYAAGSQ